MTGLSPEQRRLRDGKVTASFTPYLMAGKIDRIRSEWMSLVGHPEHAEPDWEEMWNLSYGSLVEPLALDWHAKKTGQKLIRRGEVVTHPNKPHVCCTLDSYRAEDDCVIDCKAWTSWQKIEYICSFLTPQIIVQRGCVGASKGSLLIVHGGLEPKEYPLDWTADYEAQVWERIEWFWNCVVELTPPVEMPAIAAPVAAVREVDMRNSNSWSINAGVWLETRQSARHFGLAEKELKALVNADVKRAYGAQIECVRDRAGRLSIREMKG